MHHFSAVSLAPDEAIRLTVTSTVPGSFKSYYDLFPIETSQDLVTWQPLVTLLRTNYTTDALMYTDNAAASLPERLYRTPTNQLPTALPPPDGPYAVGTVFRLLTNSTRNILYGGTNRTFMITVWYPAQPTAGVLPAIYIDPKIAALGASFCITANYRGMRAHALPGVAMATNEAKYPLIIYSHGHQTLRTDNTRKAENLASYGFIVLALDNVDCYATVFPNGTLLKGVQAPNLGPGDPLTLQIGTNRIKDIDFVLDQVTEWNVNDPFFHGRVDLDQVAVFGHSFGGWSSAIACAQIARIKAGLSLDGGGPVIPIPAFNQPFLILSGGDNNAFMEQFRNAFTNLFDRLTHDAYYAHLTNSAHCDFNESPWFDSPTSTIITRRARVQDLYVVSFFRKYLRGEDDHFLDGTPAAWPEVDAFWKK
jgi:dienelactone hydrolase